MTKVEQIFDEIKRLTIPELAQLARDLDGWGRWPRQSGPPVGAEAKSGPPTLSAGAEAVPGKE